jgi:hypothetical protein
MYWIDRKVNKWQNNLGQNDEAMRLEMPFIGTTPKG